MPPGSLHQHTLCPLEQALNQLALLERTQLQQLQQHLTELLSLLPPPCEVPDWIQPIPELPTEIAQKQPENQATLLQGKQGGGSIEWKMIRQAGKSYGPYPYWRFWNGKTHRSIYLKQLAQEQRQSQRFESKPI
jgi:hypothetical protein